MDHQQAANGPPPVLHVSTDMFGERERFDEWRETFALKAIRVDVVVSDRKTFRAATRAQPLGDIALVETCFNPVRIMRTRELVRDGNDDVSLVITTNGVIDMRFGDRALAMEAGSAALTTADMVGSMGSQAEGSALAIVMRRATFREMFGGNGPAVLRPIPAGDPVLGLLRLYARGLMTVPGTLRDAPAANLADRQLRELVAHLFDPTVALARAAPAGGLKAARLRAVIAGIDQHLINPALSAVWLGAKLGLSDRYVQHLLAEQGLSLSELVRRKRAERARQALEQPGLTPPRIVDVAFAVGFGDLSSFNRAFRERFGCTPSDVLHRRALN